MRSRGFSPDHPSECRDQVSFGKSENRLIGARCFPKLEVLFCKLRVKKKKSPVKAASWCDQSKIRLKAEKVWKGLSGLLSARAAIQKRTLIYVSPEVFKKTLPSSDCNGELQSEKVHISSKSANADQTPRKFPFLVPKSCTVKAADS